MFYLNCEDLLLFFVVFESKLNLILYCWLDKTRLDATKSYTTGPLKCFDLFFLLPAYSTANVWCGGHVNGIAPLKYKRLKNYDSGYYPGNHQNILNIFKKKQQLH